SQLGEGKSPARIRTQPHPYPVQSFRGYVGAGFIHLQRTEYGYAARRSDAGQAIGILAERCLAMVHAPELHWPLSARHLEGQFSFDLERRRALGAVPAGVRSDYKDCAFREIMVRSGSSKHCVQKR